MVFVNRQYSYCELLFVDVSNFGGFTSPLPWSSIVIVKTSSASPCVSTVDAMDFAAICVVGA